MRVLTAVLSIALCAGVFGEEPTKPTGKGEPEKKSVGSALDPKKYPQDTPEKALESIAKAFDGEDFGYFLGWLVTPDSTARSIEKFKTFEAAVEDQKTNPQKVAGRKAMREVI